jgi:hypothetical protein
MFWKSINDFIVHIKNIFENESFDVLIFYSIRVHEIFSKFQYFAKYQFHLIRFSQITKNTFDYLSMNLNEIKNVTINHWNKINYVELNF